MPASTNDRIRVCLECKEVLPIGSTPVSSVYCSEGCEEDRRVRFGPTGKRASYVKIQERRARRQRALGIDHRGE